MEVDRQIFIVQRQVVYNMIYDAKAKYYRDKISSCSDQKELFKIVESLLHQKGKAKLPSHHSKEELAEKFNNFFISKVTKIRDDLDSFSTTDNQIDSTTADNKHNHANVTSCLNDFTPATEK